MDITAAERLKRINNHIYTRSSNPLLFYVKNTSSSTSKSAYLSTDNKFLYTLPIKGSKLSISNREFYEKNGYFVVRKLISQESLERYRNRFEEIVKNQNERVPGMILMRDVSVAKKLDIPITLAVNKIQDFQEDPILFNYCTSQEILEYLPNFVGNNIMAMHTMLINKPPDPGTNTSRHPMHQDLHYFPFRPANKIVCSWTAMENVTRQNGCLAVIPGSHKGELLKHTYPNWKEGVNKMYHGVEDFDDKMPRAFLEMEAGDTVFFHPLLIHGSGANKTKGFRKAISCHYASSECEYIDVEGTVQESIAEEVLEIAKKRTGGHSTGLKYQDIWMFRARQIAGDRINL